MLCKPYGALHTLGPNQQSFPSLKTKDSKFTTSRPLNQSIKPSRMNCYPAQSKDKFSEELSLLMRTLPIQCGQVSTAGTRWASPTPRHKEEARGSKLRGVAGKYEAPNEYTQLSTPPEQGSTHSYTQNQQVHKYAFQYQVITVSAAEIIQRCQSFFLKCMNRDHSTFGAKELQILWTSCPKYTAAAPNSRLCSCYIPLQQTIACLVVSAQARLS